MARRRKVGDLASSEAECYYCEAVIPASAMRCPKCGKFFASAKKLIAFCIVAMVILASLGFLLYNEFLAGHQEGGDDLGPGPEPSEGNRFVNIVTSLGTIKIEMYENSAPVTATHFINLVQAGELDIGSFYRAEPGFVIQGGTRAGSSTTVNWEDSGLLNTRYTISMARSGDPNSAPDSGTGSSEFFINLGDNTKSLNTDVQYDYVVFGKVIAGTNIVDQIAGQPTHSEGGIQIINAPIEFTSIYVSDF